MFMCYGVGVVATYLAVCWSAVVAGGGWCWLFVVVGGNIGGWCWLVVHHTAPPPLPPYNKHLWGANPAWL